MDSVTDLPVEVHQGPGQRIHRAIRLKDTQRQGTHHKPIMGLWLPTLKATNLVTKRLVGLLLTLSKF